MMTKKVLHQAQTRGFADHNWLKSYHTFSFASYYNPERMNFGVLRVLNDDIIAPSMGFDMHPHNNMEIISIPLEGELEHKDSMGNVAIIKAGEIQVMSAGTGIYHSEYNKSSEKEGKFLQIWVFPNKKNVTPRYDQYILKNEKNVLQQILSPNKDEEGVWIHQNAWFHLGNFDADKIVEYQLKNTENGVYAFVINGNITIEEVELQTRDALGIWNTNSLILKTLKDTTILLMEVPMG